MRVRTRLPPAERAEPLRPLPKTTFQTSAQAEGREMLFEKLPKSSVFIPSVYKRILVVCTQLFGLPLNVAEHRL